MKWLFSILIIANLGLFIWLYPQQDKISTSTSVQHENLGELRLVGEQPPEVEEGADDALAILLSQTEHGVEAPEIIPEIEPPPVIASTPVDAVPEYQQVETPVILQCRSIGIFEKRAEADLVSVQLRALGLKPDISSETANEQAGYWVLIPPQPSRKEAIVTAKELEAAGVADIWRFTSGDLAHAISLGLFTDNGRAQARRDKIAALGFSPEVRPRYRQQTRYWLIYAYSGESPVTDEKWQELLKTSPAMESKSISCP
ncbi:MAG: hypothetical protein KZQ65_08630 [Candidatus Thiodiazotropha sp. (ex Gloverina cf. vestifex)]|nr:hypothetical protein [Candidatus Thiodiazotropha sp. (ex Gloverina cf. vestifex)]